MRQIINEDTCCPKMNIFLVIGLMFIIVILTVNTTTAQSGSIMGVVTDSISGKPLNAVQIGIDEINKSTLTDKNGHFKLIRVPAGSHDLTVDLAGYVSQNIPLSISAGTEVTQNIKLKFESDEGDRIFVRDLYKERSQAINEQMNSLSIGHMITNAQMNKLGDYSIQRGLSRVPGVQVGRLGELNIRGAGRNRHIVVLDGQRMASTISGDRGVNLDGISADMALKVEVIKVPTPDMDAEGISGMVNINTWRPVGEREIDLRVGGLANPRYTRFTGIGNLASVHYSEKYRENLSMAVDLSYQQDSRGYESLGIDYSVATIESDVVDVIEQLSPGLNSEVQDRFGGRLQMHYEPDNKSSFFIRGLFNSDNRENERHRNISIANGDWVDQTMTGSEGELGQFTYNPFLQNNNSYYHLVQVGSRHELDFLNVMFKAGWANSNIERNQFDFYFSRNNLNYAVNMDDRTRPDMTITNILLREDGTVDPRAMTFERTERIRDLQSEDRFSAQLDIEIPMGLVSLKAGSSVLWTDKSRNYEEADLSTLRSNNLLRFRKLPRSDFDVFDSYFFPEVIHAPDAAKYIDTSRPEMRIDEDDMFRRSLIWNYGASEDIYGAYGMGIFKLNRFHIMAGIRVEQTKATYEGRSVFYNRFGDFEAMATNSQPVSYTNLFPNFQLKFSPTSRSNLKIAWSKSLMRQEFQLLAPFELFDAADTTRFAGNPDLKPVTSNNLDLMFEHYLSGIGAFTAGAFYKKINNNSVLIQDQTVSQSEFPNLEVNEGETVDVRERTYVNSDTEVALYGIEASWQQYLYFLPGFLGNFGVSANYTWTQSTRENQQSGRDVALQYQSPHVVNAALDYNQSRFSGQVAWHWTDAALFRDASETKWAPAINRSEQIYLDLYEEGWMDLSASFGFRLTENFRFWANASNLLTTERTRYGHTSDLYPFDTVLQDGIRISAGLQFTL